MNEIVDVVVITYCSAKYVLQTLDSIYAQTYQKLGLIVSDDCSTDKTVEICKQWLYSHKERFVHSEIIETSRNQGTVFNCQRAFEKVKAEYYVMIAGDDYLAPTHTEKCVAKYTAMPNLGLVYTSSNLVLEKEQKIIHEDVSKFREGYIFDDLLLLNFWPKSGGFLFRTEVMKKVGGYNTSIWVEDFDYALRIAKDYPIGWVKEYLMFYRLHSSNIGGDSIRLLTALMDTLAQYQSYPLYTEAYARLESRLIAVAQTENPWYLLHKAIAKRSSRYLMAFIQAIIHKQKQYAKNIYHKYQSE